MAAPGMSQYPQIYYEDLHITENQKSDLDYLKGNMDHWVSSLVQPKDYMRTLRNYYNGVRDDKEFEYLTENFGIGTPSSLKFTNIIKPRVDSIVAQLESDSYTYTASCIDNKTIDLIQEEKKEKKIKEIEQALALFASNMQASIEKEQQPIPYSELKNGMNRIKDKYSSNFVSDFEIAAQRVCTYFEKSNEMELRLKLSLLVHDLAVLGECYYRVYFEREGSDPIFDTIKPENFFHNKNTNNPFLDGTDAVVRREYLTHKQVAGKYGKFMTADQMQELFGGTYMSRTARNLNSGLDLDLYYGEEDPVSGQKHLNSAYTVEVLHIEWLATNEVTINEEEKGRLQLLNSGIKYKIGEKVRRMDRYEGVRIASTVYVNCGKSEQVPRSSNDPYSCGFSYGGLLNNDRNGRPYSIVGALKDLQDIYDLTMFHRDNLIANSGVKGDRINIAGIPKVLGDDFMTRLFKFIALKKNGVELIDPTEQGAQLFNHYGNFDNTVDGNSLQAINGIIAQIEHQANTIAGVTAQMLGNIQEREAVSNVQTGLKQSMMINQPLFELFRGNQNRIIRDLVNCAQLSYKNGKKISYIAGGESFTFEILPENFIFSDYAVSITYASKDAVKVEQMKVLSKELISAGMLDPDVVVKAMLSDSITEISQLISKNWAKKKAETDQLGQMSGQLEQYEKQVKELTGQLSNITQQLEASKNNNTEVKAKEVELKHEEARKKLEIEENKASDQKDFNDATIELKEQVVQLEREQLYLGAGNAKEIKNF